MRTVDRIEIWKCYVVFLGGRKLNHSTQGKVVSQIMTKISNTWHQAKKRTQSTLVGGKQSHPRGRGGEGKLTCDKVEGVRRKV